MKPRPFSSFAPRTHRPFAERQATNRSGNLPASRSAVPQLEQTPGSRYGDAMKPFPELTVGEKRIEILRWLCVLPAALLGGLVVQFTLRAVLQITRSAGLGVQGDSTIGYAITLIFGYVLPKSAFVIAGAKTAPRHQTATSIALAVVGVALSLMTHVVGQHLAGNRVGSVHFIHAVSESAGLLVGAAFILVRVRSNRAPA